MQTNQDGQAFKDGLSSLLSAADKTFSLVDFPVSVDMGVRSSSFSLELPHMKHCFLILNSDVSVLLILLCAVPLVEVPEVLGFCAGSVRRDRGIFDFVV